MKPAHIRAAISKRMADNRERTMGDILNALGIKPGDIRLRRAVDAATKDMVRDGELSRVYLPCDGRGFRATKGMPVVVAEPVTVHDEETYGRAWRELARKEGHAPALPKMAPENREDKHVDAIMLTLAQAGRIRRMDLVEQTGITQRGVEHTVKQLTERGLVKYEIIKGTAYVEAI